jgi:hypothetical protein
MILQQRNDISFYLQKFTEKSVSCMVSFIYLGNGVLIIRQKAENCGGSNILGIRKKRPEVRG